MPNNRQGTTREAELYRLREKKLQCQAERENLALRIEALDREIIEIQAEYGSVYNEPAPLLRLSTEVICLIFDYAVAAGYTPTEGRTSHEKELLSEVVVSHVCHQWRSVSLAYPRLWTCFRYDGPRASRIPHDRLDAYLERSASQLLELWFNFRDSQERDSSLENQLALFERAIPAIARWKRVTVLSDPSTPISGLLPKIELGFASSLEHFAFCPNLNNDLYSSSADSVEDPILKNALEPTVFKNGAPKLESLTLDCSGVAYACLPPLSNITTLRLESMDDDIDFLFSWTTCLTILSLPFLENLSLVGHIFEAPEFFRIGLITMNSLKHLRFSDNSMQLWLHLLRAPLLETLIIQRTWFADIYGNLTAEPYTFPSLKSLSLIETSVQSAQTARYLAQMTESATEIFFSENHCEVGLFYSILNSQEQQKETYWSKVVQITFNFNLMGDHVTVFHHILRFVRARRTNNLIIRIFECKDECWKDPSWQPEQYEELKAICTIKKMPLDGDHNPLWSGYWPLGEYYPAYLVDKEDPFDIKAYY